jgi:hypothetical protein
LRSAIAESHFRGGSLLNLGELPIEDSAALGLGLMALLTISLGWVLARELRLGGGRAGRPPAAMVFASRFTSLLVWLPWVSLAVYTAKVATTCAGRLITPYYPLLLAGLLRLPGHEILVRRTWWRRAATGVLLLALSFVVVNPARPLWPAQTILAALQSQWPDNRLVERAARVYATYADRHDALAPIRDLLPASEQRVGLAGSLDCPEASLWRPFGSRKMIHMLPGDSTTRVREAGVEYVILTPEACELFQMSMEQWLREYNAEVVNRVSIAYLASHPPQTWLIVRLRQTRPEGDR